MNYAMAAALQSAVFQHLEASTELAAFVGTAIYDAAPPGHLPGTYVSLGPEDVRDRSDQSHSGAAHTFVVTIVTDVSGFHLAKTVAAVICDGLIDADLTLDRGRLVSLAFASAKAERMGKGAKRKIDLRFRALLEDN